MSVAELPEPARCEIAKVTIKATMANLKRDLALSDTLAIAVLEAVLGEQRASLAEYLANQLAITTMPQKEETAGSEG